MSHQQYSRWVTFASIAAVTTATLLIIGKLIAWLMTDSSTLLASLTDSFMDVSASIINLLAIRYALAPADDEHRFGHGKACLLYTSPSPRDGLLSRMPSSA